MARSAKAPKTAASKKTATAERKPAAARPGRAGSGSARSADAPPREAGAKPGENGTFPRYGIGYDAHRLEPGRNLILGGVELQHVQGLAGHSDADVLLHAIIDALLGAAALGDIGHQFPDSDDQYHGAESVLLLAATCSLLESAGYRPVQLDATLIAEGPRIAPHVPAMRARIANALGIDVSMVSIKATTQEGMGWIGRGEGMGAFAIAQIAPLHARKARASAKR